MRKSTAVNLALLLATLAAFGGGGMLALADGGDDDEGRRGPSAYAVVTGPGGVEGIVRFTQEPCPGCPTPGLSAPATDRGFKNFPEPEVTVSARVKGLTPGAHGFHIHEMAFCDPPFAGAGGHFDPGPFGNSTPVDANHPYHMGDLQNLIAGRDGVGRHKSVTSRVTLSPGPLTVFDANGSAVIVHLNPDRGIPGVTGASGGPRVACGIIQMSRPPGHGDDD